MSEMASWGSYVSQGQPRAVPSRAIRVLIAEDHRVTLFGLQQLIGSSGMAMEVAGTAVSRAELLAHPALPTVDIVLLDLDLGGEETVSAIAELQARMHGHVLVLTGEDDETKHRDAVMQGARGVVHKTSEANIILRAIEKVHGGEIWLHRNMMADVLGCLTSGRGAGPAAAAPAVSAEARKIASLTPREREIVTAMVANASAKQFAVASQLGMSEHTLRNHLTTIYSKLCVRGRLELHVYATEHGLAQRVAA